MVVSCSYSNSTPRHCRLCFCLNRWQAIIRNLYVEQYRVNCSHIDVCFQVSFKKWWHNLYSATKDRLRWCWRHSVSSVYKRRATSPFLRGWILNWLYRRFLYVLWNTQKLTFKKIESKIRPPLGPWLNFRKQYYIQLSLSVGGGILIYNTHGLVFLGQTVTYHPIRVPSITA